MSDASALIRGVSPVLATPFCIDGAIDYKSFRTLIARVIDSGITSMMFPGFASEFFHLSQQERARLLGELLQITAGRAAVIGSVTESATYLAQHRATEMVDAGISAMVTNAGNIRPRARR